MPARGSFARRGVVREQRVLQRVVRVARAGMHDETGRLVHDQDVCVLPGDDERQRLRDVRDGVLVGRVELDTFAAADDVARPQHAAIDAQHAVVDPALQARARELRQGVGQRLVEAPSGRLRRQAQFALVTGGTHAGLERSFAGILR